MDFRFTEEQEMMAGVLRDLLADHCQPADLRRLMETGAPRDEARWARIVDLGLQGILVPEDRGGLGLQPVDFVLLAEAAGYAALPEPLIESAGVVLPLLAAIAPDSDALAAALEGGATVALAHPANAFVADADTAGAVILAHGATAQIARPEALTLTRQNSIDPFRRLFTIKGEGDVISSRADVQPALDAAFDRGALFAAAQLLGIAQRCVDLSVAYACERQQFGKPIGSYQAIKHHLATCQVRIEFARPVLYAAAADCPRGDMMSRARISQARIACAAAADLAARTAVQVHGAMGYSWEVDVHFFLKRALALSSWWGSDALHRDRVATRVLNGPIGPDATFAKEAVHA
ncbi:acyl-CoA dehydrogenase family protein [Paracoccus sp. 22332]|uniref:acyl-CoA dehydrogenase family protein n=1 Tax=Paracoccus sp. 22332 TaxID=3453913 RepID=UPI003F876B80